MTIPARDGGREMKLRYCSALILSILLLVPGTLAGQSMTIEDCISLARENNPRLTQLKTSIEKSRVGVTSAYSSYYPSVDLSSGYRIEEAFYGGSQGSYSTGLSLSYPIYRGGNRSATVKSARAALEVSQENYRLSESQVILEIKQAFYRILQKQEQMALTEDVVERRKEDLVLIKLKYDAGRESLPAVQEAEASLLRAEYDKKKAEEDLALAEVDLNLLLGRPASEEISLEYRDDDTEVPPLPTIIEEATTERPELKSEEASTQALRAQVTQARSNYLPSVSLSSSYRWQGEEFFEQSDNWSIGLNLSVPIFDGFSTKTKVQEAKLSLENQDAKMLELRQQIEEEIQQAYSTWKLAQSIIDVNERTLEATRNMYQLTKLQYEQGITSYFFLQQKESDLTQAENSHVDALYNLRSSRAKLEKAWGRTNQ
jgi:outer membrane protein